MSVEVQPLYTSSGCNRSPHCLSWQHDILLYGSCNSIVVSQLDSGSTRCRIIKTLAGHSDRVNSIRFIGPDSFVSTSTDKKVFVWQNYKICSILSGHTSSVTVADGIDDLIASASGDSSIKIWNLTECIQTIPCAKNGFALDIRLIRRQSETFLAASMDNLSIGIYTKADCSRQDFILTHALYGHEDWVQTLAWSLDKADDLLLASGGQDHLIRVWRIKEFQEDDQDSLELKQKEETFQVQDGHKFAVNVDTILAGHEDKVLGLDWSQEPLNLVSCSLDKTMIVWQQTDDEQDSSIWTEKARVGDVGGNTLGFMGCQLSRDGNKMVGYSFNGALHLWQHSSQDGQWQPGVVPSGHFGPVVDMSWETEGQYLISTSSDQTTRVHALWHDEEWWAEIARPQVHGYDLACLTTMPGHKVASGAEEKVVRVFEATNNFLDNLTQVSHIKNETGPRMQALGASVPSLGLSNKAVLSDGAGDRLPKPVPEEERHVKDQFPEYYFTADRYSHPPPEETLVQNTLWPEVQKLYGHGYEIFSLASDNKGLMLASACKASQPEHAQILLWDTTTWKLAGKLSGHSLTVVQMQFSPCDQYLLSVSRDRTWCLFKRGQDENFELVAKTDKATSVHQRIIWACDWTNDSRYFATVGRDKKLAIWTQLDIVHSDTCTANYGLACQKPLTLKQSITAVAFAPFYKEQHHHLIVAGMESGSIVLIQWAANKCEEWTVLKELDQSIGHHLTVTRLRFRPTKDNKELILASCSSDHAVKLFKITY